MRNVPAYGTSSANSSLGPLTIARRDVGLRDVAIDVAYTGVCHTDVLNTRDAYGPGIYPMVPGHEFTGLVSAVGSEVTKFAVGDRVGVGNFVDSCRECEHCLAGLEVYCQNLVVTYNGRDKTGEPTYGGYSSYTVVDENYVLRIPDALDLDVAAPLLCAAIAVYSPLRHWEVGPGTKLAIVGMGGLGHLAIKIAHALGAEVTVLSQGLSKRDDGLAFGADDYRATSDPTTFTDLASHFDVMLSTVSAPLNFDALLGLIKRDGTLINLGAPDAPVSISMFSLILGRKSFASSATGGIAETQEMLDFCAEHGIKAEIETIDAADLNSGYERLDRGDVRYRFVVDVATISK
ncbi:NAD(P)-dependent alcohol dehydrogenase [Promicromonospora sp. CA-289599]|uniref:NAD(P)-dependent alcohol dehydrogenase n=1 Tax=Promicromonospora sp. CA-289599 TaxID=3240014 RepID=UPI003D8ADEFB